MKTSFNVIALAALLTSGIALADGLQLGRDVFINQCSGCHSVLPGKVKVGPSLFGVVGRHTAQEAGYDYSQAMQHANLIWDRDTLIGYLSSPQKFLPGVKMTYPGLADANAFEPLYEYLSTLK